jgi:hypothetical protein
MPKKPSMVEEKKNGRARVSINLFLEQVLMQQRDEMMEIFSHILQHISLATNTSSSSNHFGGISPFKLQVNFDIPVFVGHIDQGSPPHQTLVGNLLGEKLHRGIWNICG